jgi:hypothetical protein
MVGILPEPEDVLDGDVGNRLPSVSLLLDRAAEVPQAQLSERPRLDQEDRKAVGWRITSVRQLGLIRLQV